MSVKITGYWELQRELKMHPKKILDVVYDTMQYATESARSDIERKWKRKLPIENEVKKIGNKEVVGRVFTTHIAGAWFEFGTRAHIITPKVKKWLHFFWEKMGGVEVFAKRVRHPGTPAKPAFRPAFKKHFAGFANRLGRMISTSTKFR